MSGFSLRQRLDIQDLSAFFSLSCDSSFSPSSNPSFVSCLQWKHIDKHYNVLSLSSPPPGAVIGDGQSAVASNIANTTYRLQWWDFTKFDLPEISNGKPRQNWGYWWKVCLLLVSQSSETHIALIFHHLVEQLTAVCYFCSSSPALVKQFNRHVLSTHPEQRTMLWYSDQNSAKVDTKVKMSAPGVYRLVVHCPKPRSLGGTERKRRRRECRN